jgi:hypothetical protein
MRPRVWLVSREHHVRRNGSQSGLATSRHYALNLPPASDGQLALTGADFDGDVNGDGFGYSLAWATSTTTTSRTSGRRVRR